MSDGELPQIDLDQFRACVTRDGATIKIEMFGTADTDSKPSLDEMFARVHEIAVASYVRVVAVDMHELEFMNSSSLKAFLTWFRTLRDTDGRRYKVELHTSPTVYWQRRSIRALVAFAPEHVSQVDG